MCSWHVCEGCSPAHWHHHTVDGLFLASFVLTFDYLCVIAALARIKLHSFIVKLMDISAAEHLVPQLLCKGKKHSYSSNILRSAGVISAACFIQS